jgi:hypothetical protein
MQTTKLLLAFLCANGVVSAADGPESSPKKLFEYHFATLRGSRLQPAGGLQPAPGLQPSAGDRGAGAPVTRPTSEEEWRRMFPKKAGEK